MGQPPQVLLVSRRGWLAGAGALSLALSLGACRKSPAADEAAAQPGGAYFLWAGVRPPARLAGARTVYVLAGEVRHGDPGRFVPLRAVPRVAGPAIWLTVRTERLDWGEGVYRAVLALMRRWQAAGLDLVGLQVDFDAATRGLERYGAFLAGLRARLPRQWRLSVTGLLDWSAHGDPEELAGLAGTVDEIVVQTYQGRRTIPGYERYLATLERLPVPFRIGVVEDGGWRAPPGLEQAAGYRGTVVFLLDR